MRFNLSVLPALLATSTTGAIAATGSDAGEPSESMLTNMICVGTLMMVDRWNKQPGGNYQR